MTLSSHLVQGLYENNSGMLRNWASCSCLCVEFICLSEWQPCEWNFKIYI